MKLYRVSGGHWGAKLDDGCIIAEYFPSKRKALARVKALAVPTDFWIELVTIDGRRGVLRALNYRRFDSSNQVVWPEAGPVRGPDFDPDDCDDKVY